MGDRKAADLLARMAPWRRYPMADLESMLEYSSRELAGCRSENLDDLAAYHGAEVDEIRKEIRRRNTMPPSHLARGRLGSYTAEIVKDTVPIEDYIQPHVDLRAVTSKRFVGLCPMHAEKTPSFTVYSGRGFYCFGCGWGGDIFDFAMQVVLKTRDFVAAVQEVGVWGGLLSRGGPPVRPPLMGMELPE